MNTARWISRHAILNTCIWVRDKNNTQHERLAFIYELDGLQMLVRVHDGKAWSELRWMPAMDGPIIGTPPADYTLAFSAEAKLLSCDNPPVRPQATPAPAQSRRQKPTGQLSLL